MATNISIISIHASAQKVWDILTKPELIKRWQYGSDLITNWEIGSDIKFRTEWEGKIFEQWGKVLVFRPYEFIQYSLFAPRPDLEDKPENYFVMNYRMKTNNESTILEIIQEDNRPNARQAAPQGEENPILQMLKKIAEGE
jgi:uncharacterized protein YndB with AHSA1/START domain